MSDKQSKPLKKKKIAEKAPVISPTDKATPAAGPPANAQAARKK